MSVPLNLETNKAPSVNESPRSERSRSDAGFSGAAHASAHARRGLSLDRRFTAHLAPGSALDGLRYERRRSVISNPDGSTVFKMDDAEVPVEWSQLATDIVVSKYFRKTEVPQTRSGEPHPGTGSESSVKQVVRRIALAIRQAGERLGGYFATEADGQVFQDELEHMLVRQMGAFNSPAWFNCGLAELHGIKGKPVGNWFWSPETGVQEAPDAYSHPQISACFIQSISDDLMDIAAGVQREMRLFKFGSGTGTNFSRIRGEGELLSSGGTSSGLMSFLEIFDKAAGATKSGGTTRRAAKMVCLDMDHPDVERFIQWKSTEEDKVLALIRAGYSSDFNGDAYRTVSGQNSNNSVRVTDEFMSAVLDDREWQTRWRTTGEVARTHRARDLMKKIAHSAWRCADPGVQFDTTIQNWHTVPVSGRIHASNPCSEFMFLDDTSCNLASINLMKFLVTETAPAPSHSPTAIAGAHSPAANAGTAPPAPTFDIEAFRHACRIFILAQEIIVDYASYPTKAIAQNSHDYRPLGLGYANLGTLLMVEGVPYDSPRGLATCGAITAIMTGAAYEASAEIAASKGPFPGFAHNRDPMLRVMNQHRDAAYAIGQDASPELLSAAREAWDRALAAGERWGYRNAQATVLAPTGTIGLLMDCDTTGIEPDFALVKFKKLAGGGYFKIVNQSVQPALRNLGYTESEVSEIVDYLRGTLSFEHAPHVNRASLLAKGLLEAEITRAEAALPSVFQLRHAFSRFVLGDAALARLGFAGECEKPSFDLLEALGFTPAQIEEATEVICGRLTIEGAPHLKTEHLPVFDCANRCGKRGKRFIAPLGHVRMMAAAQPFVSGAISKTVNLPKETSVEEVEKIYVEAWRLGLKAIALYRDGSKASQVLSSAGGGGGDESRPTQSESKSSESSSPSHSPAATAGSPATKAAKPAEAAPVAPVAQAASPETASAAPPRLARRRLPKKRAGFTQEARVGGQKIYIRTGEYEDGSLGEIFIDMHKEGAAFRSLVNCFAISISLGLQHGVPLEEFVDAFTFTRFEPHGPVDHPNIKSATSVIDFIFRMLGMEYLGRTDFVHVKPADSVEGLDEEEATPPAPEAPAPVQLAPVANAVVAQHSPTANAVAPGEAASQRRSPVADAPAQAADSARPRETRSVVTETQSTIVAVKHASGTNGNGAHAPSNGSQVTAPTGGFASGSLVVRTETRRIQKVRSALSEHASNMMGDAPACSECGHITIRNGTCYRCVNCGHSMGCS